MRLYYHGTANRDYFRRHSEAIRAELTTRGLQPSHRVLDIGSGIGNVAVSLIGFLHGGYDGLDVHAEAVALCRRGITAGLVVLDIRRSGWATGITSGQDGMTLGRSLDS